MKNNKGITLIALIITIIVLVILAGVALNMLFGNDGILNNAQYAKEQYEKSAEKEAIAKAFSELQIKMYMNEEENEITAELLKQQLNNAGYNVEIEVNESGNFVITFKNTGDVYEVTKEGEILGEDKTEVAEEPIVTTIEDKIILDLEYTGKEETIELEPGKYKLEVWGAQGGNATRGGKTAIGGFGSYAVGIVEFTANTRIFMNVGGRGVSAPNDSSSSYQAGGYNGGGSSRCNGDTSWGAGGGATAISLSAGLLKELSNNKEDILIVAGGGGGAGLWSTTINNGGNAGGFEGNEGSGSSHGYGGTQENGGSGSSVRGGFGYGGGNAGNQDSGGGSGYYGGGTGHAYGSSAGGGSGYIGSNQLSNKHMTGYKVKESRQEGTYTISVEKVSEEAIRDYAKQGDGHIKITKLVGELNEGTIPVYTQNHLEKVGKGEKAYIIEEGNFYNFTTGKTYVLQNNITFYGDFSEIQNLINTHQVTLDENGHTLTIIPTTNPTYFKYTTTATAATITGLSDAGKTEYNNENLKELIFPKGNPDGLPITAIAANAFKGCTKLTNIHLSDGLLSIGKQAFYNCTGLVGKLDLPNGLTTLLEQSFYNCTGLTEVYIPKSLTNAGEGEGAFDSCNNMSKVTFEEGITKIVYNLFDRAYGIKTITIPSTVVSIDREAFWNCTNLEEVIIPNSVTSIGYESFGKCVKLTSLPTMNGVTSIGFEAFVNCTGITGELRFPNSLKTIGENAFYGCTNVTAISGWNNVTSIGKKAFYNCTGLAGALTLPNGLTTMLDQAFYNCIGLTEVYIPKSLTNAGEGEGAFDSCNNMSKVTFEEGITKIVYNLFDRAYGIKTITIPNTVTSIDREAFWNCKNLEEVIIPNSVTSIGYESFGKCVKLTSLPTMNGVTSIGFEAFVNCTGITGELRLPSNLKTIGESAFYGCTNVTDISGWNNVTSIGKKAFYNCTGIIGTLTLPNGLTTMLEQAFYNCTGITGVYIPKSLTNAGTAEGPFNNCSNLQSVTFEEGITQIIYNLFDRCTGLRSITIPNTVTKMGNDVFYSCINLETIVVPNSVTSIGISAFGSCVKLTTIPTMNGITNIPESAFSNCTGMTEIIFDRNITTIGKNAFSGCNGLTSVTYPGTIAEWKALSKGTGNESLDSVIHFTDDAQINLRSNNVDIEYIQGTGSQYINSGYRPGPNTGVEVEYQFTTISPTQQRVFGIEGNNSTSGSLTYTHYINGNSIMAYGFKNGEGNWIPTGKAADTNKHTFKFNRTAGYWQMDDGEETQISGTPTNTAIYNMYIMAANANGSLSGYGKLKMYSFKIYEGNTLVRNFVPVQNTYLNQPGLYDTVAGKFYGSCTSTAFVAPE